MWYNNVTFRALWPFKTTGPQPVYSRTQGPCFFKMILVLVFLVEIVSANWSDNGSFECYIDTNDFRPCQWEAENFARSLTWLYPEELCFYGYVDNWRIDVNEGLGPLQGYRLLVIKSASGGHCSGVSKDFYVEGNRVIKGRYFFGTSDYLPYNDYATIRIIPTGPNTNPAIELLYVDVNEIGNNSSMWGWGQFSVEVNYGGWYRIEAKVCDAGDDVFDSFLVLDCVNFCNSFSLGDLDFDCCVNFFDFSVFVQYLDANEPFSDLDQNGNVDLADMMVITDQWLNGY